jgi:hypothetical protein
MSQQEHKLNHDGLVDCYVACREFVRKCDRGEASSKRSYAQMKAACEMAEKVPPGIAENESPPCAACTAGDHEQPGMGDTCPCPCHRGN